VSLAGALAAAACVAWAYLMLGRGFFWLARERDDAESGAPAPAPATWPSVVAVVPARDEADVIARSLASLLAQDYPGDFSVIVVDDASADGTAAKARSLAAPAAGGPRLEVLAGAPLPAGWTGKLWAIDQGVAHASGAGAPDYFLLTDADIAHAGDNLRRLVARAEAGGLTLVSLMALLSAKTWAERLLIPAFVFFFAMLFPFAWVNDPGRRTAAAAGGCMLLRRDALEAAGGIGAIAGEIIDDCALAARMKAQGPIWLGFTSRAVSLRPYGGFGEIAGMIARSAYAQLRFSPVLLVLAVAGMGVVYLSPPLLLIFAHGAPRWAGAAAWAVMGLAFQPMLRFYRLSPLWGLALPAIGGLYGAITVVSAVDVWRGRGGLWKGRAQAVLAP
jgi:hopene-associated glycosyltransferase HpnB